MRGAFLLAALTLLAGGCGASEDEPPSAGADPPVTSFDEARGAEDGTPVELGGAVYADDEPMRVCRELAESFPPQCGHGVPVLGVSWEELPGVQRASGVTWTERPVGLVGEMHGGVLHVTELREPRQVRPHPGDVPPGTGGAEPPVAGGDEPVSSDD
jgi:hypothetical protein